MTQLTKGAGRRSLAGGALAGLLAATAASASSFSPAPPGFDLSPGLLVAWRRYLQVDQEFTDLHRSPGSKLRQKLVDRYGELRTGGPGQLVESAQLKWGHDPDYARLKIWLEASDVISDRRATVLCEFLEVPVATLGDVVQKLTIAAEFWTTDPERGDHDQFHERLAHAAFAQANTFLVPLLPTELSPVGRI